ncbi:unnamed protein product [Caretta caretta]
MKGIISRDNTLQFSTLIQRRSQISIKQYNGTRRCNVVNLLMDTKGRNFFFHVEQIKFNNSSTPPLIHGLSRGGSVLPGFREAGLVLALTDAPGQHSEEADQATSTCNIEPHHRMSKVMLDRF